MYLEVIIPMLGGCAAYSVVYIALFPGCMEGRKSGLISTACADDFWTIYSGFTLHTSLKWLQSFSVESVQHKHSTAHFSGAGV